MKSKNTTIIMILATIVVLGGNPGELKAQIPGMPSQELMEFYVEYTTISFVAMYIPGLIDYNETLYEGEKVTSDECVKFDEAIGTIASVMKKAFAGVKNEAIKKEMQLTADSFIKASKLYADYHKTGKEDYKDKADELIEVANEHWEKAGESLNSMFGGE